MTLFRILLIQFLISLFFSTAQAQNNRIEAYVVLNGSSDTLIKDLSVSRRIMRKDFITLQSVLGNFLTFYDFAGNLERISLNKIAYLKFIDFQGIERTFVAEALVGIPDRKFNLIEVVYKGSIKFYRQYQINVGTQAGNIYLPADYKYGLLSKDSNTVTFAGPLPLGIKGMDYFTFLDQPPQYINLYDVAGKKALANLTKDDLRLYQRILDMETYEELVEILEDYDSDSVLVQERINKLSFNNRANKLDELSSINIDSVKSRPIKNSNILVIGDYIKYVGPGPSRIGIVRKIVSLNAVQIECDLLTNPRKFTARAIDVELILD